MPSTSARSTTPLRACSVCPRKPDSTVTGTRAVIGRSPGARARPARPPGQCDAARPRTPLHGRRTPRARPAGAAVPGSASSCPRCAPRSSGGWGRPRRACPSAPGRCKAGHRRLRGRRVGELEPDQPLRPSPGGDRCGGAAGERTRRAAAGPVARHVSGGAPHIGAVRSRAVPSSPRPRSRHGVRLARSAKGGELTSTSDGPEPCRHFTTCRARRDGSRMPVVRMPGSCPGLSLFGPNSVASAMTAPCCPTWRVARPRVVTCSRNGRARHPIRAPAGSLTGSQELNRHGCSHVSEAYFCCQFGRLSRSCRGFWSTGTMRARRVPGSRADLTPGHRPHCARRARESRSRLFSHVTPRVAVWSPRELAAPARASPGSRRVSVWRPAWTTVPVHAVDQPAVPAEMPFAGERQTDRRPTGDARHRGCRMKTPGVVVRALRGAQTGPRTGIGPTGPDPTRTK